MDIDKILAPFRDSLIHIFETMISLTPEPEGVLDNTAHDITSDITGTIGITGDITGTVSVRFPKDLACRISSLLLGTEISEIGREVGDAVGEIANMVAGGAKGILIQLHDLTYQLAIPSVVLGSGHTIAYPEGISSRVIPFALNGSKFYLEICLKK